MELTSLVLYFPLDGATGIRVQDSRICSDIEDLILFKLHKVKEGIKRLKPIPR